MFFLNWVHQKKKKSFLGGCKNCCNSATVGLTGVTEDISMKHVLRLEDFFGFTFSTDISSSLYCWVVVLLRWLPCCFCLLELS